MADVLVVIDMQPDYIGLGKKHAISPLVENVNKKIKSYPNDRVIYILNRFFWDRYKSPKLFLEELNVVSEHMFEKRRPSCFSNLSLVEFLVDRGVTSLELIGVDGNGCIKASALSAARLGYDVELDLECIGVENYRRFRKTLSILSKKGVKLS